MHSSKTFRRTGFPKNNETSLVSVDKNSSRGGVVVGNLVACLGVVMDTGLAQGSIGTSEAVWRGPGVVPWADCRLGTNELIGEDLPVIIRLGANQLMS